MTLNDDLIIKIKQYSKKTGKSFKETVNTLLSQALVSGNKKTSPNKPLKINIFKGKKGLKDPSYQDMSYAEMIEHLDEDEIRL